MWRQEDLHMAQLKRNGKKGILQKITPIRVAQWIIIIGLVAFCEYAVRSNLINRMFLAAPSQILDEFLYMLRKHLLWQHVIISLEEFAVGYSISAVSGIVIGVIFVLFPKVEEFLSVFVSAFMAIPKSAILPLLIVWFGIGFSSKVVLIVLFCFFTILFNTVSGTKQTRPEHLKVAEVFKAGRLQTVFKVFIPSALPSIFTGLRITAATAITSVIFAEMTAAKMGLGYLLTEAQQVLNTPRIFVVIIVVTILSVILVSIVNLIEYLLCHRWKASASTRRI